MGLVCYGDQACGSIRRKCLLHTCQRGRERLHSLMPVTARTACEVEIHLPGCLQADSEQGLHRKGAKTGERDGVRKGVALLPAGEYRTVECPEPLQRLMKIVAGKGEGLRRADGCTPAAAGTLFLLDMDLCSGNGQGPCRTAVHAPAAVKAAEPPAQTSVGSYLNGLACSRFYYGR